MKKVVVITGGIGSGKSEVCRILARMGYDSQYEADTRVKALYSKSEILVPNLEQALGMSLRDGSGAFVPSLLAARIFSDKSALNLVEEIVFPVLERDFEEFVASSENDVVIFESATVLEKEFFAGFGDAYILVTAPYEVRLERAIHRDNASTNAVRSRMDNQKMMNAFSDFESVGPQSEWYAAASRIDAVVESDCSLEEMVERVAKAMKMVLTKML